MAIEPAPSVIQRLGELADRAVSENPASAESASLTQALAALATAFESKTSSANAAEDVKANPDHEHDRQTGFLDRFRLDRVIGSGGFAVVVQARDLANGRDVAIKFPKPETLLCARPAERFQMESRLLASLDHPNIVPVFESGLIGPLPFIVTAYCPGPDLATWRKEAGSALTDSIAVEIIRRLADAVHHCHQRGILHRDIKPSNVLLFPIDDPAPTRFPFVPKLTDFGLGREIGGAGAAGESGIAIGTIVYMAPEQARGDARAVGPPSDVYGLGVVLFELLTGHLPFPTEASSSLLRSLTDEAAPSARRYRPGLARDLDAIVARCLETSPQRRYGSAAELRDDLNRFLAKEPVAARPVGRIARLGRWCERKPLLAGLCGALVVVSTIALAATAWQARQRRIHEQEAKAQAALASSEGQRAEASMLQAQRHLFDLAWIQRQNVYVGHDSDFVNATVEANLDQFDQFGAKYPLAMLGAPVRAALLSVKATKAARGGDSARAKSLFEESLALWRQVLDEHPGENSYRRSMILTAFGYRFLVTDPGGAGLASNATEASKRHLRAVFDQSSEDAVFHEDYAILLLESAFTLSNRGRRQEALKAYQRAQWAFELLSERDPTCARHWFRLGQTERFLAMQQKRSKEPWHVEATLLSACQHLEHALELEPDQRPFHFELGEACRHLGAFYREKKSPEAEAPLTRAIAVLEPFCRVLDHGSRPSLRDFRLALAATLGELGVCALQQEDDHRARETLRRAALEWRALDGEAELAPADLKKYAQTVYRRAMLLDQTGPESDAIEDFALAKSLFLRLDPRELRSPADSLALANCLIATGDLAREQANVASARADYERALAALDEVSAKKNDRDKVIGQRRAAIRARLASLPAPVP